MITVMELLSYPIFQKFSLVSSASGLVNQVSGTGIFEWESEEDINKTFRPGEFVMTTLSAFRENPTAAEEALKPLVQKGVCAICIKTVYFNHVSSDFIQFANDHQIPVFLFSDVYMDDIIFTVKNALVTNNSNQLLTEKVLRLAHFEMENEEAEALAKGINPFFHEHSICCTCSFHPLENAPQILEHLKTQYTQLPKEHLLNPQENVHSLIWYDHGFMLFYTANSELPLTQEEVLSFLNKWVDKSNIVKIGVSRVKTSLQTLGTTIRESFYANVSCQLDNEEVLSFQQIGLDQSIIPLRNNPWVLDQYNRFLAILVEYDENHNTNLMETLIQYIKCSGDIVLTSSTLYQHANTIRYRLGKIKQLLGINDSMDSYCQLYYFVRLYQIYQLLEEV